MPRPSASCGRLVGLALTCMASLSGCASSGTTSSGASVLPARPATQTINMGSMGSLTMAPTTHSDVASLPFTANAVFMALPAVYDSLGIPLTTVEPDKKRIGNEGFKTRQRLAKVPLSRYLDCGTTQIGPNADSYDVFLSVVTMVTPDGTNSAKLTTVVDAQARPITVSQEYSACATRGGLEQRIVDIVKAKLSK